MVRNNHVIANAHFHKKWKEHVKMWFDQPMKKKRRAHKRKINANSKFPRPSDPLRPIIQCPTVRYNTKTRIGRGFSLEELKRADLVKSYAQSIGIAVDKRRRNKSLEGLQRNVQRLQEYLSKLIVYPLNKKKRQEAVKVHTLIKTGGINEMKKAKPKGESRVPSKQEKKFCAYQYIRNVRTKDKVVARDKRKRKFAENLDGSFIRKKPVKMIEED